MFQTPYSNYNYNPYQQRLQQLEQQAYQQPIQTIQQSTPQSQCFFVNSKDEMQSIQPAPNVFYIGMNKQSKEIYVRAWNNNGIIDFDTYTLSEGKKEESELKIIMNKLESIEERLNERNDTDAHAASNVRSAAKPTRNAVVQSNDERQKPSRTVSDDS